MFLVSSFSILLQELAIVMTSPSFHNFTVVATGWVFALRFFSLARWSLDALGLAVFRTLEVWLPEGSVLLALDDTLAAKRGLKVFGAGMHYDPQLSSRNKSITRWGGGRLSRRFETASSTWALRSLKAGAAVRRNARRRWRCCCTV